MKVAIVGAAPSSRSLAPFASPDWEIWCCSPGNMGKMPRVTAWFELHAVVDLRMPRWAEWVDPYCAFLRAASFPVYMQEANELVPNAVAFPHRELARQYGGAPLTSSIAWMMAYALDVDQGATEIALFGVDMAASTEHDYERPGCQYFIRHARDRGIKVHIPPQSDLDATAPLYGIGDSNPMATRLKAHWYEMQDRITQGDSRLAELEAEKAHLLQVRRHLEGAMEENVYVRRTWLAWSGPDT